MTPSRLGDQWPTSSFAVVMGSEITSTALNQRGATTLSWIPLGFGVIAYLVLVVVVLRQLLLAPRAQTVRLRDAGTAFGCFTFVAASGVLATRLVAADIRWGAVILAAVTLAAWVVLTYAVPAVVILRTKESTPRIDGGWLLWTVATQSASLVISSVDLGLGASAAPIATALWCVGVVLYVMVAAFVLVRLLSLADSTQTRSPSAWILTGATAVSVLAACHVLALPDPFIDLARPLLTGVAYLLWSFGTWWIPLLLVFGVWRYAVQRQPIRYEIGLWSIVFPVGMYATATGALASVTHLDLLAQVSRIATVVAGVLWLIVAVAMLTTAARSRLRP